MDTTRNALCEMRRFSDGSTCGAEARFRVQRGREYDAQDSCGTHLAMTVSALIQGENVPVTVRRLPLRDRTEGAVR